MTEAEAAWVREHVWPRWMRDAAVQVPSLTRCACHRAGHPGRPEREPDLLDLLREAA